MKLLLSLRANPCDSCCNVNSRILSIHKWNVESAWHACFDRICIKNKNKKQNNNNNNNGTIIATPRTYLTDRHSVCYWNVWNTLLYGLMRPLMIVKLIRNTYTTTLIWNKFLKLMGLVPSISTYLLLWWPIQYPFCHCMLVGNLRRSFIEGTEIISRTFLPYREFNSNFRNKIKTWIYYFVTRL